MTSTSNKPDDNPPQSTDNSTTLSSASHDTESLPNCNSQSISVGSSSKTTNPVFVDASSAPSVANNISITTLLHSSKNPKTPMADKVLLRGKDGSVVASATVMPGEKIHGHQLSEGSLIVAVDEVVQAGAEPWFEEPFDEELCKGVIVEWPEMSVTRVKDFSPIHTRKRRAGH